MASTTPVTEMHEAPEMVVQHTVVKRQRRPFAWQTVRSYLGIVLIVVSRRQRQ